MAFLANKTSIVIPLIIMLVVTTITSGSVTELAFSKDEPTPRNWPEKFHALLVMNYTDTNMLVVNNLWYDWQNGLNVQLMQHQQGKLVHAVSWNNGTSFYFTLRSDRIIECIPHEFGVGILRPNFLEGANYLGQVQIDGFLCNLWEKEEFIWYYEDVVTKRPIHWLFYTGLDVHVMTFEEVDEMVDSSQWQAPDYCFGKAVKVSTDSAFVATELSRSPLITLDRLH
ncbi:uncharacterized protein At4g14100-like [Silene latifolia]|uniref:uncharacterized protein At4g14100-like n=1 Tax=Silene latifolia TaxID=37657 RepID=UPI003D7829D7